MPNIFGNFPKNKSIFTIFPKNFVVKHWRKSSPIIYRSSFIQNSQQINRNVNRKPRPFFENILAPSRTFVFTIKAVHRFPLALFHIELAISEVVLATRTYSDTNLVSSLNIDQEFLCENHFGVEF